MNKFKYLIRSFKSRGFYGTLSVMFHGYLKFNKFIVFCKNLSKPFDSQFKNDFIQIKKISINDLKLLRGKEAKLPIEFYCDVSHKFSAPYIALVGGKLAAIYWLVFRGENSRFLELKNGDVELNYSTVLPQFRGERLGEMIMAFIIHSCNDTNLKRIFGVVNVNNIPQYKPMLRMGFEPVEVLTHFGFHRPKATLRYVK